MMEKSKYTDSVWVATIIALGAYEIWTLANDIPSDTMSESVWRASSRRPLIPFMAGLFMGHLFWQQGKDAS